MNQITNPEASQASETTKAESEAIVWPSGCRDQSFCVAYRFCGYFQCPHAGKLRANLHAEMDASAALDCYKAVGRGAIEALQQIARGRLDCGRALSREDARQIARQALTDGGMQW